MSVYKKLQECRCELQKKKLKKSGKNKFAGYEYFELGDFLPAINDMFLEKGLCSIVTFNTELATLTIHDLEDDSCVLFTSPFGSADLKGCHPVQNIGAVETYQRRYLYMVALEIVEYDALEPTVGDKDKQPAKPDETKAKFAKAMEAVKKELKALGNEKEYYDALGKIGVTTHDEITDIKGIGTRIYGELKARIEALKAAK